MENWTEREFREAARRLAWQRLLDAASDTRHAAKRAARPTPWIREYPIPAAVTAAVGGFLGAIMLKRAVGPREPDSYSARRRSYLMSLAQRTGGEAIGSAIRAGLSLLAARIVFGAASDPSITSASVETGIPEAAFTDA